MPHKAAPANPTPAGRTMSKVDLCPTRTSESTSIKTRADMKVNATLGRVANSSIRRLRIISTASGSHDQHHRRLNMTSCTSNCTTAQTLLVPRLERLPSVGELCHCALERPPRSSLIDGGRVLGSGSTLPVLRHHADSVRGVPFRANPLVARARTVRCG